VSEDQCVIEGCPENGPAIAVDDHNTVHVVWPTLVSASTPASEPMLALFYAATHDGQRFSSRQRIHTEGVPRRPQIAVGRRGSLLMTWDEQINGTRRVVAAEGVPDERDAVRLTLLKIGGPERSVYRPWPPRMTDLPWRGPAVR
jgi:hypothetical protein